MTQNDATVAQVGAQVKKVVLWRTDEFHPERHHLHKAAGSREFWPGQKKTATKLPEALVEKILAYSSSPGDVVLDPFLGSGTVGVVAQRMGRRWIGIEIVDAYAEFAADRVKA